MSIPNFVGLTLALSLAAAAGVATYVLLAAPAQTPQPDAPPAVVQDLASARAENASLQSRVRELEEAAAARSEREQASKPTSAESAAPDAPAAVVSEPAFVDPRFGEALGKIDWALVGQVTKDMQPLLAELVRKMMETGEVPLELAAKIQELNSKLVAQVPAMMKSGAPGFGPNGSYTHPLFVANTLAATLAASGKSLSPEQLATIDNLVKTYSAENDNIVASAREFDLEHLLAEAEMKDRFFADVSGRLTPEQQAQLFPKDSTEYDGANLFGTGLMTRPYANPIAAKTPADFARTATNQLTESLGLSDAAATAVRTILTQHASDAKELWSQPADSTETSLHMLRGGRTTAALRRQLEVLRAIQQQVELTPEQKKKLKSMRRVLVPLPG